MTSAIRNRLSHMTPNSVHVWRINLEPLDFLIQYLEPVLSHDELERSILYLSQSDRKQFIIARGILRFLLSTYIKINPARIKFCYGKEGKPRLIKPLSNATFNISHSNGRALIAISQDREVGIDIEYTRTNIDFDGIARRFWSHEDQQILYSYTNLKRKEVFYQGWVRKEAYLKARGIGILCGMNQLAALLSPSEFKNYVGFIHEPATAKVWTLRDLHTNPDFAASLVIEGQYCRIEIMDFNNIVFSHNNIFATLFSDYTVGHTNRR
jgi:4'-phosphopantetheinyl transferase